MTARRSAISAGVRIAALGITVVASVACGDEPDDTGDTGTTTSTSGADTTTTDASSGPGATESTGGIPEACPDVALETGIVGRTDVRTCDILAECVMPTPGIALAAYDQNPQVGGGPTEPGTPAPGIMPIAELSSGVGGRYEFLLPAGTYYVCVSPQAGSIFCAAPIVLSDADPVVFAEYESYMPPSWTIISCGLGG